MQINGLKDLLKGVQIAPEQGHKPSLPAPKHTPKPERTKVVSTPTRIPINRQAALVIRPNTSWISQPLPPEKLPNPHQKEIDALKAELKIERNDHAETRDKLGNAREQIHQAKQAISTLVKRVQDLEQKLSEREAIIRQLEDLRL